MNSYAAIVCLLFAVSSAAWSAAPEDTEALISQGISAYDTGDYAGAIATFEEVLDIDSANYTAAYELALSHTAAGDLQSCIKVARKYVRKVRNKSEYVGMHSQLSMLQASCHSQAGETRDALRVFRAALEKDPDDYGLNFNIAITLAQEGQNDASLEHIQKAVVADPAHPSPYYVLGSIYHDTGMTVEGLLAYFVFLQREFNTPRTTWGAQFAIELAFSSVSKDAEDGGIAISLSHLDGSDMNPLLPLEMFLSLHAASKIENDSIKEPVADSIVELMASFVRASNDLTEDVDPESFVGRYLLPDVAAIEEAGVDEPFAWFVVSTAEIEGAADWLDANPEQVDALVQHLQFRAAQRDEAVD
jgi:tetratricopeptide (TPR) repeat protein